MKVYSEVEIFLPRGSMTIIYLKVVWLGSESILIRWLSSGELETTKVLLKPSVNFIWVATLVLVENEMSTWLSEMGVIRGAVKISDALTRFS